MKTPQRSPKPNLHVFATDTDRRFALFILAMLSTSLYFFHSMIVTQYLAKKFEDCLQQTISSPTNLAIDGLNYACSWQPDTLLILGSLTGEFVIISGALLIYWLYPRCICRFKHLRPLHEKEHRDILDTLEKIRSQCIPSIHLHYVFHPSSLSLANPSVFAGLGSNYLLLAEMSCFYDKKRGRLARTGPLSS
jgi:hypothetical protein